MQSEIDSKPWAMILAAGLGKRLNPLTDLRPKPSLELLGRPIIHHLLDKLIEAKIKDVAINLHHLPKELEKTIDSYNNKSKINIHLLYEEKILGTAGGLKNAILKLNIDAPLMLMHADIAIDFAFSSFLQLDNFCTLLCLKNKEVDGYVGSVGIDEDGHINTLGKYFSHNLKSAEKGFFSGVHFLSKRAVHEIKSSQFSCLVSELYPLWLKQGRKIHGIMKDFFYEDLGSLKRLYDANMAMLNKNNQPYAYMPKSPNLIPPFIIKEDVIIKEGAIIGPNVILGPHVHIGEGARIENSVIMAESKIEKHAHIKNSLVLLDQIVLI